MRLSGTKTGAVNQYRGLGNQLWDLAGNRPSLDLPFSDTKSLVDTTTGKTLVDHTRASSGTYVGSDGLIKTATTNLLLRSEEFDNAGWAVKTNLSVSANAVIAPNGTLTADKLVEDSSNAEHFIPQTVSGLNLSNVHTFSVYLKSAERLYARVRLGASGNFVDVVVNLLTGTLATPGTGGTGSAPIANATSVGDDWFRVSISGTNIGGSGSLVARVDIHNGTTTSYQGDGTSGIYLWGAQLEQSSSVGEYIPTTSTINSAPRFDHNPTTGESLGLLVEEQRTNLCLQSEDFSTTWTSSLCSVTTNTQTAPNGTLTADTLTDQNGSTGSPFALQTLSLADSTTYVMSCFIKAGTKTTARVGIRAKDGTVIIANFDLAAGTTTVGNASSSSIQRFGDGWFRCSAVCASATGATSQRGLVYIDTTSYTADGTGTIHVWGAQLEAGAFPTSYIPTTGSTVTRAADVASISGSNFSSWFTSPSENTFYVEAIKTQHNSLNGCFFSGGNGVNALGGGNINFDGNGTRLRVQSRHGSVRGDTGSSAPIAIPNSVMKGVLCTSTTAFGACVNGQLLSGGNVAQADWGSALTLGWFPNGGYSTPLNGYIGRLTYWPQRLGNEVLQRITQ